MDRNSNFIICFHLIHHLIKMYATITSSTPQQVLSCIRKATFYMAAVFFAIKAEKTYNQ